MRLTEDLSTHWKQIAAAADISEEASKASIIDWMNHTEVVAGLYMRGSLEKVSHSMMKPHLISFSVVVRTLPMLATIRQDAMLDESTFEYIRAFERKYRDEISFRLPKGVEV